MLLDATQAADRATATSLFARLSDRSDQIAHDMVAAYQEDIPAYRALSDDTLIADVTVVALNDVRALLSRAAPGGPPDAAMLESIRRTAVRRAHQGIPLDSLLRAHVVTARVVWDATRRAAEPAESDAAAAIGDALFRRVDAASRIAADAYRREARSTPPRPAADLFDALVSGRLIRVPESGELADDYAVVVARAPAPAAGEAVRRERLRLLRMIDTMQQALRPSRGAVLTGLRDGDVIALVPLADGNELERVAVQCDAMAATLAHDGVVVGVSSWRPGHAGVAMAVRDARSAADVAEHLGVRDRATRFDEVIVEHILRTGDDADDVLGEILGRLRAYDRERRSNLLETLRVYVACDRQMKRAAAALHIVPNTLAYRLGRIAAITERDPTKLGDLLVLVMALKWDGLRARTQPEGCAQPGPNRHHSRACGF